MWFKNDLSLSWPCRSKTPLLSLSVELESELLLLGRWKVAVFWEAISGEHRYSFFPALSQYDRESSLQAILGSNPPGAL